jgi:hypothetical protein
VELQVALGREQQTTRDLTGIAQVATFSKNSAFWQQRKDYSE